MKREKLNEQFIVRESEIVYTKYKKVKEVKFSTPATIFEYFRKELEKEGREVFFVVFLNSSNEVIGFNKHSSGTVDQAVIYPRESRKTRSLLGRNQDYPSA